MARLPTVMDFGERPNMRSQRQIARINRGDAMAPGMALANMGNSMLNIGAEWEERTATADAKRVDAEYADIVRNTLYGDDGYLIKEGGAAVEARDAAVKQLQSERERLLEGLGPKSRAKAEASLGRREDSALQSTMIHAHGEHKSYVTEQGSARINSAIDDVIADPSVTDERVALIESEIAHSAARMGWSPEVAEQKLLEATTSMHTGVINRVAAQDPIQALGYLQDNRDAIDPGAWAKFESILVPAAKEWSGRQQGRAAHDDFILYSNQGAIRNKPISQQLEGALGSFLPGMGITMEVFSGGQDAKGHGHQRTGSTRHDHGNAADVFFYKDGRRLNWADPKDRPIFEEIVRQGKAAGITGWGAGEGYMQEASMHLGFGSEVVWGKGGKGANAPQWLRDAYAGAESRGAPLAFGAQPSTLQPPSGSYMQRLLDIEDPTERASALKEFNLQSEIHENTLDAAAEAARNEAFLLIESGGDVGGLSLEQKSAIGQEGMSSLYTYQTKAQAGIEPETDDALKVELFEQMSTSPQEFAKSDPLQWRENLSDKDFDYFLKQQADIRKGGGDSAPSPNYSRVNTQTTSMLEAYGFDKGPAQQTLISNMLSWEAAQIAANGIAPTDLDLNKELSKRVAAMGEAPSTASVKAISPSQASTAAKLHLERAGLKKDVEAQQFVQADLMEWSEQISRETGELPNSVMVDRKARQLTSKVEFDPSILPFNALEFHAFEAMRDPDIAEIDPLELMNKGFTVDGVEIGQSAILTASGEFYAAAGRRATTPELITYFTEKMAGL